MVEKGSQMEPKKRSRRFYVIFAAAILTLTITVGVVIFEWSNLGQTSYGPGPVYIDKVTTDKPYYLQGEKVNLTVTVNNPQNWSVVEPSYIEFTIEHDGFPVDQCSVNIDYAWPPPTFPPHSKTSYNPPSNLSLPGRPGNYTLIVSFDGLSNGSCTVEVRLNPASYNYTEAIMAGDWIKYDISVSWTGSGIEPTSVTEFKQIDWEMNRIQMVGAFLLNITTHFKNGTDLYWLAANSDQGISYTWLIFPSGLKKGDTFQLYAWPLSLQYFIPFDWPTPVVDVAINDTITRNYAGSSRSVNVLSLRSSNGGFEGGTLYWDQKTGVLLEFVLRASLAGGTVQWSYKVSETNMW